LDAPKLTAVVHAGPVGIFQVSAVGVAAKSETSETVLELHAATRGSAMRVMASDSIVARAGTGFEYGEPTSNTLASGRALRLRELKAASAWAVREAQRAKPDQATGLALSSATLVCIEENARLATLALQEVLTAFTPSLASAVDPTLEGAPSFKGYRLLKRIGQGGMSRVFLAERESDRLLVALKVLDLQTQSSATALASNQIDRFVQEYALVSRVSHPNVVRIFDQGFTDDHAYIAMEYFDSGDVKQLVKSLEDKSVAVRRERAYSVLSQAAAALVAVHEQGITHRDIKPENLMFRSNGTLGLADFGIAKHTQNATLTQHGFIVGTPLYLSPEQACGKPATPQSDLYSLGVIFYELLTCKLPFTGENVQAILAQHMIAPVPKLPPELADAQPLIDWLLAKDASHRCTRATTLVERLRA
jgi:serine/threonine-protein kinase PpkA